jgi:two-component system chemotaxis sensor kinase CheA
MNEFDELTREFFLDARERLSRVEELLLALGDEAGGGDRTEMLGELKRELHTVKGNSGMMGMTFLQKRAHDLEDSVFALGEGTGGIEPIIDAVDGLRRLLDAEAETREKGGRGADDEPSASVPRDPGIIGDPFRTERPEPATREGNGSASSIQASVRVSFQSLDELVELLAEMVIFRNRLADAIGRARLSRGADSEQLEIELAHEALARTLNGIQERVLRLRMVPLRTLFSSLRRIVHDEGRRERRDVRLEVTGGETPIDKALLETASEALGHLVRNAVIHGIEDAAVRSAAGKPAQGRIRLSASSRSDDLLLELTDDGHGIDRAALVRSARQKGLDLAEGAPFESLLFHDGVSTREKADIGSGRGVGLGAVKEAVDKVGGRVEVESTPGMGTTFRLRLPLTVSILRALLVVADGETYAIPLSNVLESLRFGETEGRELNHALVYRWRGKVIPLVDIATSFGRRVPRHRDGFVLVIESDNHRRAILADEIVGIREIVVKGLDPVVGTPVGISGSTILGDGRVVLILDPRGLVTLAPFFEDGPGSLLPPSNPARKGEA